MRIRHADDGRPARRPRLAAALALLACLATSFLGGWHALAHDTVPAAIAAAAVGDDPAPPPAADHDCAFHCDHHGRGITVAAVAIGLAPTSGQAVSPPRSAAALPRPPETPLEPPRA